MTNFVLIIIWRNVMKVQLLCQVVVTHLAMKHYCSSILLQEGSKLFIFYMLFISYYVFHCTIHCLGPFYKAFYHNPLPLLASPF